MLGGRNASFHGYVHAHPLFNLPTDNRTGGLDLCFGRWDVNQHPIADAHPSDLDNIVFPGQDFNNARIYDFEDVTQWENNKLDRTKYSRMGWSVSTYSIHHFCRVTLLTCSRIYQCL